MEESYSLSQSNSYVYDISDSNYIESQSAQSKSLKRNRKNSTTSCSSEKFPKSQGSKRIEDRFYNLKSILNTNEDTSELEDDDVDDDDDDAAVLKFLNQINGNQEEPEKNPNKVAKAVGENLEEDDECINDFDEASNWNDFDIETLNFDKFIKDHQPKNTNEITQEKQSKTTENTKQNNLVKRKRDLNIDDNELKAKRRVF